MHFSPYLVALIAPLTAFATPIDVQSRQSTPIKPTPCVRNNSTTEAQTEMRSKAFAHAFIYEQDITKAFKYIASDYIVSLSSA
jgi:hypothetical protein